MIEVASVSKLFEFDAEAAIRPFGAHVVNWYEAEAELHRGKSGFYDSNSIAALDGSVNFRELD